MRILLLLVLAVSFNSVGRELFPHQHGRVVEPAKLKSIQVMTREDEKKSLRNYGELVVDPQLESTLRAVSKDLYEGMKKVVSLDKYSQQVPQFEVVLFEPKEPALRLTIFNVKTSRNRCFVGNTFFVSAYLAKILNREELTWAVAHELIHVLKTHACISPNNQTAFYRGDLLHILDMNKAIDAVGGEAEYIRRKFPDLNGGKVAIFPGTPEFEKFEKETNVFTSEIEADEAALLILQELHLFKVGPVIDSYFQKMAKENGQTLDCDKVSKEFSAKAHFDILLKDQGAVALWPPICNRYQNIKAELSIHQIE